MQSHHRPPYICVAPMLDWTDRHCRYFLRLFSPKLQLYTEMVTTGALLYADDPARFLAFSPQEQPLALQLGGSDPQALAICTQRAQQAGFIEVNLNVGCPSSRVQNGQFGACLMLQPQRVADCILAMCSASALPVTVKTRIGVDDQNEYGYFRDFIATVNEAGCQRVIIHARNAWLNGLSPKENRCVPPLRYDWVYQLKRELPDLTVIINGGITTLEDAMMHCQSVDGVMIGRESYHNPYYMATLSHQFYQTPILTPYAIIKNYLPYAEKQYRQGVPLATLTKPIFGLLHQRPGARAWRRYLSENAHKSTATPDVILRAYDAAISRSNDIGSLQAINT